MGTRFFGGAGSGVFTTAVGVFTFGGSMLTTLLLFGTNGIVVMPTAGTLTSGGTTFATAFVADFGGGSGITGVWTQLGPFGGRFAGGSVGPAPFGAGWLSKRSSKSLRRLASTLVPFEPFGGAACGLAGTTL